MPRNLSDVLSTSASELDRLQRQLAFQQVYDEGRWRLGADGAECGSGWSAVHKVGGTREGCRVARLHAREGPDMRPDTHAPPSVSDEPA
tara:strand:+ start:109 stop:375 length:267 start_codon:yes stop_codon:yes gene_type:complete